MRVKIKTVDQLLKDPKNKLEHGRIIKLSDNTIFNERMFMYCGKNIKIDDIFNRTKDGWTIKDWMIEEIQK